MINQTFLVLTFGIIVFFDSVNLPQDNLQWDGLYLMVVDMQQFDYKKAEVERSAKELTGTINDLVTNFDPDKIIYIQSASLILNVSFKGIRVDTLPPADLDPNLKLIGDNLFTKAGGNAFTSEELNDFLEQNKVRKIALAGLMAGECVYNTAMGGLEKGYDMYIIPEAVIGKSDKKKEKAIGKMSKAGVGILTLDQNYKVQE